MLLAMGYGLWAMGQSRLSRREHALWGGAEKNGASETLVKDVFCQTPIDALLMIGPIAKSQ
jgi:hypothetical protein